VFDLGPGTRVAWTGLNLNAGVVCAGPPRPAVDTCNTVVTQSLHNVPLDCDVTRRAGLTSPVKATRVAAYQACLTAVRTTTQDMTVALDGTRAAVNKLFSICHTLKCTALLDNTKNKAFTSQYVRGFQQRREMRCGVGRMQQVEREAWPTPVRANTFFLFSSHVVSLVAC
jgi:hypothetical protein